MSKENQQTEIVGEALFEIAKQLQNLGWGTTKDKGSIGKQGDQIEEGTNAIASGLHDVAEAIRYLADSKYSGENS